MVVTPLCLAQIPGTHWKKQGAIRNARVATVVAEVILSDIYGEANIRRQRPFKATIKNGLWTVTGSLPKDHIIVGGTAEIVLRKSTGEVIRIVHWR